ncbi:MAG: hypothetical protein LCH63_19595 [Candidatus Melainabacteria bacterium]|nr:hypothetical protein [Candidatus Melainabacteria bacterium]
MGIWLIIGLIALSWVGGRLLDSLFCKIETFFRGKEEDEQPGIYQLDSRVIILPITWKSVNNGSLAQIDHLRE